MPLDESIPSPAVTFDQVAFDGVDVSGLVANSAYDANTILAATSDNTPAALTVGEQTLVGRITAGNIAALSVSQVRTLLDLASLYQPLDSDLTDIAALTTTTFGRARLTEASGWVPVSDTLVSNGGSGVASISVSCSGYRHLRIRFKGRSLKTATTTDSLTLTVNSDTNSRYSVNGGALTTTWTISSAFVSSNTNTDRMGSSSIEIDCGNSSWSTLRSFTETPTSTSTLSVAADNRVGIYNQTSAITSLQIQFAGGNIADGSSLIVEGWA